MPPGGMTPDNAYIVNALRDYFRRNNIHVSEDQLMTMYLDLKAGYVNAGREVVITKNGKPQINPVFMRDITSWATNGVNPYTGTSDGTTSGPPEYAKGAYSDTNSTYNFPGGGNGQGKTEHQKEKAQQRRENQRQNYQATYQQTVTNWGIAWDDTLAAAAKNASQNKWSTSRWINYVRGTQEYKDRFVGIFNEDGTLKFSEGQYMQREQAYQDYAAQLGVNMSDGRMGWLFKNDVSPAEFRTRGEGYAQIQDNPDMLHQFRQLLMQHGYDKADLTDKELFKTIMGEGNHQWKQLWQMTQTRYAAVESGITIAAGDGMYGSLPKHLIAKVAGKGLSESGMEQGFAQLADQLATTLPESKIQSFGLSKAALVAATFGGKNAEKVRQKVKMILAQQQAVEQDRGNAQYQSYVGQGGRFVQAGTEGRGTTE